MIFLVLTVTPLIAMTALDLRGPEVFPVFTIILKDAAATPRNSGLLPGSRITRFKSQHPRWPLGGLAASRSQRVATSPSRGTPGNAWGHFGCHIWRLLLLCRGERPEMLLNTLPRTGQPLPTKGCLTPSSDGAAVGEAA